MVQIYNIKKKKVKKSTVHTQIRKLAHSCHLSNHNKIHTVINWYKGHVVMVKEGCTQQQVAKESYNSEEVKSWRQTLTEGKRKPFACIGTSDSTTTKSFYFNLILNYTENLSSDHCLPTPWNLFNSSYSRPISSGFSLLLFSVNCKLFSKFPAFFLSLL